VQVLAEGRVHPLDARDRLADPGGDRLAGALALVAEAAASAAEADRAGQLVDERVPARPGVAQFLGRPAVLLQVGPAGRVARLDQGGGAQQPRLGEQLAVAGGAGQG